MAFASVQAWGWRRRSPLAPSWTTGYLLAGPALLAMIGIFVYPLVYSFVMSFFRWDLTATSQEFRGPGQLHRHVGQS